MEPRPPLGQLLAHLIDEDYQVNRPHREQAYGPSDSQQEPRDRPVAMRVQHEYFDPGERIPSYESSQEQEVYQRHVGRARQAPEAAALETIPPPTRADVNRGGSRSRSRDFEMPRIRERDPTQSPIRGGRRTLKTLGLKFLNARQHFLLAACRDLSLVQCVLGLSRSWWLMFRSDLDVEVITSARTSEHFLTGIWCIVAGYLLYSVLDGLMVRWIVSYTTTGSIVRMATLSAIIVVIESYLVSALLAEGYNYALHTWILISCALTVTYIIQNFITSNIDLKGKYRPRFFDFYNIVVFAVVPVGMASFITMIGLLRSLLILRLDIDQHGVGALNER